MVSGARLLLIEDNPGDARLLDAMLDDAGSDAEVEWVQSLDEGVRRLTAGDFDAVLLDLSLPDSHGIESVATTHLFDTRTPIIVLTGLDDDEAAFQALREGAQDYLVKGSFDGPRLLRTIRFAQERVEVQRRLEDQRAGDGGTDEPEKNIRALVVPPGGELIETVAAYIADGDEASTVLYVCFDRPAAVLRGRFQRRGVDVGRLHFIDASGQPGAKADDRIHVMDDARDLDRLAVEIEHACAALGPDVNVMVDSVNSLILLHGVDAGAVFCHSLANRLRLLQIRADFVGHDNQEWPFLADRLSFLDGEIRLNKVGTPRGNDPGFA